MSSALLALSTIEEIIKEGNDLIQESIKEVIEKNIIPYHCDVAPSYDKTKMSESIKMMDDELKIIIAGTNNELSKLIEEKKGKSEFVSWDEVISCMQNNVLIEEIPGQDPIVKSDKFTKTEDDYFKFDGSPSQAVVNEVKSWFTNFIGDPDVLADTHIDISTMANIVAQTGALVTNFFTLWYKKIYQEKQVVDVGVLRFPDLDRPYFQVYRIQLTAWADCTRIVFYETNANGISAVYNSRKYQPRSDIIDGMKEEVKKKAEEEADNMFP